MSDAGVKRASPVVRRVRAYFAPVNRVTGETVAFDVAGEFDVDAPPAPWVDLGWVHRFTRTSGTKIEPLRAGAPAAARTQVRVEVDATVAMQFARWGKLQLALTAGTQQMNLLPGEATAVLTGSTASVLHVGAAVSEFGAGDWVAVDNDYAGETGYVGSGVSGAYVRSALEDVEYVRRVTLNVARVRAIADEQLLLESPLIAGVPSAEMKVCAVAGFCDREGSSFFQEWSGLFVMEGQQGDRVVLHYPRLQAASGAEEAAVEDGGLETLRLAGTFRALAVRDAMDGEQVVCFRGYLPA